ncbi:MAG: hypothetical protein GEU95_11940 [Rhizobiales bacterium]|nr:hypothetical protein [Hyphomicrobiales bacterium]
MSVKMGLLDLPSPALSWLDASLATALPSTARIVIWGTVGAAVSMSLYWLLSPQQQLARIAIGERRLKMAMRDGGAEMADDLASAGRLLWLAITRIGLMLVPALVSAVPVVCLMTWLHTHYGHEFPPPGQKASIRVEPAAFEGRWIAHEDRAPRVDVVDDRGIVVHSVSMPAPVPLIHKRVWWSFLIGNPLGYLPSAGSVERIEINLPERRYLFVGPEWIRGWEAPFMTALLVGSVLLKLSFRIR